MQNAATIWRVLLLTAALANFLPASAAAGTTQTVTLKDMGFNPRELTIHPGDTVEWKNEDMFAHTATADDKSFDSGLMQPGQSWKKTFANAGDISYHCTPHPNMRAKIIVTSASASAEHQAQSNPASQSLRFRIPNSPEEWHPILVNFTAALLPLALFSDILGLMFKRQSLHNAAAWMVLYEALITPVTVAAGWWWKHQSAGGLPPKLITVHQWLGTTAAFLFIILALWRWNLHKRGLRPSVLYLVVAALAVGALAYQGSLGGAMVFGK